MPTVKSWVLLRARTTGNAFDMNLPLQVADLLQQGREQAAQADVQLLAASGLLYAASGQRQATREMTWVGGGATAGILLLLLLAFRRWRVLLAFVPVLVGMLFGAVACVAMFGHMHVMTLVLGSSLIGVAVDYPLHYLSKSWSLKPWHSWPALRLTLPGLTLSLITSCIGYLALAWTPFPALTQIAVFSAAGLVGAYLCAVCLLPALLKGVELRPAQWPLRVAEFLLERREALLNIARTPVLLALLIAFCVGGLLQLEARNDIRQWVGAPQQLTDEAQAIARITGYQPTSQFFLVRAANQQQLLERQAALGERLDQLVNLDKLKGYLSLNQLVSPPSEQVRVREALNKLPQFWHPLARPRRAGCSAASGTGKAAGAADRRHRRGAGRSFGRTLSRPVARPHRRRRSGAGQPARPEQPVLVAGSGDGFAGRGTGGSPRRTERGLRRYPGQCR